MLTLNSFSQIIFELPFYSKRYIIYYSSIAHIDSCDNHQALSTYANAAYLRHFVFLGCLPVYLCDQMLRKGQEFPIYIYHLQLQPILRLYYTPPQVHLRLLVCRLYLHRYHLLTKKSKIDNTTMNSGRL